MNPKPLSLTSRLIVPVIVAIYAPWCVLRDTQLYVQSDCRDHAEQ
jgi:hypothetical protein